MAQHICEDLMPIYTHSTVPTFTKALSDHGLHQICAPNPFPSQVSQEKSSNSMVSLSPNSGEHLLKESAGDTREEDYPVSWFKLISSMCPKTVIIAPLITEPTPVHVAYTTLASMSESPVDHQPP